MSNYKTIPRKYHILFWLIYFSFNTFRWAVHFDDFPHSLKSNLIEFTLHIALAYFNIYVLIPKFIIERKKYGYYFLTFFISLIVIYILKTELSLRLYSSAPGLDKSFLEKSYKISHFVTVVFGEIYVITFVSTIKFFIDWVYQKRKVEILEDLNLKTELQFLKAQIQPHFFFNTLNNLYALTLENSKQAPEMVLKLSEIMEYVLYDAKEANIRLFREIKYIQNYIDIEKLRFGNKVKVKMSLEGDIENQMVSPLLFLPFIENCFKHGTLENNMLNILIEFKVTKEKVLEFKVTNNYNVFAVNKGNNHGIGNKNILRRLELLYKDKFTLNTKTESQNYIVNLTIQL